MFENAVKYPKNQELAPNKQSGNIIFWILIFVALFAALSYTVSSGSRSGDAGISQEQANLAAAEILDYAGALKRVVQELQINGCSDTEISFENAIVSGYSNPNSPSDNSCHVFHPNGGGLQYVSISEDFFDTAYNGQSDFRNNIFTGSVAVQDVGSSNRELLFILPYLSENICDAVNNKATDIATIPVDIYTATQFIGTYSASANPIIGDNSAALENENIFCARREANTYYYFTQVLITR